MLITGRLREYPLSILLEIFRHKGETGLLEISSLTASGSLYLKDGQLVDAALGNFRGAEAVRFGETLADASFQFNSLPPDEYLRLVWDSSLENERKRLTSSQSSLLDFHLTLTQFLSHVSAAYGTSEKVVVLIAQRTIAFVRLLDEFTKKGLANVVYELRETAQSTAKLLPALRTTMAERLSSLRGYELRFRKQITLKYESRWKINRAIAPIKQNATTSLPPPEMRRARGVAFAVVPIALLIGTLIFQLKLRGNQDPIATDTTASANISDQSQAHSTLAKSEASKRVSVVTGKRQAKVTPKSQILRPAKSSTIKQTRATASSDSNGSQKQTATEPDVETVPVELLIENGRVSGASLLKQRPGMEALEAAALRFARQRRYGPAVNKTEFVLVKMKIINSHPD